MAHYQQNKFLDVVHDVFPNYFENKRVLEVGSWDVNGSVRNKFVNCEYVGVDICEGRGVDKICEGQNLDFPTGYFDVAISCECFEHNRYWLETFTNMIRMLRPGGLCVFTCATIGRGEHGTARRGKGASLTSLQDLHESYYVNLEKYDFLKRIHLDDHFVEYRFFTNVFFRDLFFIGIKTGFSSSSDLKDGFLEISKQAQKITTEKGVTFRKNVLKKVKYRLLYNWAKLLGEKRYHDLIHYFETLSLKVRGK